MMRLNSETRRHGLLPLLAVGLLAGFVFVFLPLSRTADRLDGPLTQTWRNLANALGQTNATQLDFVGLTNQYNEALTAQEVFLATREQARARVALTDELQQLLRSPFQLVDYENEVRAQMARLAQLSRQRKVTVEPAVWTGFPLPTSSLQEPALLWAELAFLETLLTTAINAQVTSIHTISSGLPAASEAAADGSRGLTELPVQIELTGALPNVLQILETLPLRADEIKAAGLPEVPAHKPALFIDRLVLRKQSRDKPDEARVSLRVVGFVLRP